MMKFKYESIWFLVRFHISTHWQVSHPTIQLLIGKQTKGSFRAAVCLFPHFWGDIMVNSSRMSLEDEDDLTATLHILETGLPTGPLLKNSPRVHRRQYTMPHSCATELWEQVVTWWNAQRSARSDCHTLMGRGENAAYRVLTATVWKKQVVYSFSLPNTVLAPTLVSLNLVGGE